MKNRDFHRHRITQLIVLSLVFAFVLYGPVSAESVQFEQTINPPNCSIEHTIINVLNCPAQPPTVETMNVSNEHLVIRGKYDSVHSLELRVLFNNVWYSTVLSSLSAGRLDDAHLVTSGNAWSLTFSNISPRLAPGVYKIYVGMLTFNREILTTTANINVYGTPHVSAGMKSPKVNGLLCSVFVLIGLLIIYRGLALIILRIKKRGSTGG